MLTPISPSSSTQIEAIITSSRFAYSISTLAAGRLAEKLKKDRTTQPLSNKQRETLLGKFVGVDGEGWLVVSQSVNHLSPNSLSLATQTVNASTSWSSPWTRD